MYLISNKSSKEDAFNEVQTFLNRINKCPKFCNFRHKLNIERKIREICS